LAQIFLSYSREDLPRVKPLVHALETEGYSVWWDRELVPGENFESTIDREILEAQCVIAVWTARSVQSQWVRNEALEGMDRGILVPITLDDVRLPVAFKQVQAASLVGWPEEINREEYQRLLTVIDNTLHLGTAGEPHEPKGLDELESNERKKRYRKRNWLVPVLLVLLVAALFLRLSPEDNPSASAPEPDPKVLIGEFVSESGEEANIYADSLGAELITHFGELDGINPVPTSGSWQQSVSRIASGVFSSTAVYGLSGRVALEGEDLAVAVTLTDLKDDALVWEGEYLEPEEDILELQRTIALDVYNRLQSRANLPKGSASIAKRTIAPAAYRIYLRGMDKLRRGESFDIDEAITLFNQALEQEPQFSEALAATCRAFIERYWYTRSNEDFEKGKAQCKKAQELEPDNSSVQLGLGEIAVVSGELSKAEYHYGKSIELDPGNVDAIMGLARVAAERGDIQSAEALYIEATERKPTYWRTHNKLGTFYYIQGLYGRATEAYLRFAQLAPTNANAFSNLGAARFSAGDFEGAIEAWADANEASPLSTSYTNTGVALYHMGRMDEAIQNFETALKMEPEDHFLWGNLGDALRVANTSHDYTLETYSQARELALADLDVNDKDFDTLARMAVYSAYLGDPSAAKDYATKAERIAGDNFYVLYDLGVAHMILGDSESREQYVERALALGFPKVLYETDPQFR
jgi:adenylate cyclase